MYALRVNNLHIRELNHGDTMTRIAQTTRSTNVIACAYAVNLTVAKIRNLSANSTAARNVLITTDQTTYQMAFKDVVYALQSNTATG